MIKEITARVLLSSSKQPDPWFGCKYTMNLYRGCQHQCIYCDSRSECYQIENFSDVLVKVNAIDLLRKELPRKRTKGINKHHLGFVTVRRYRIFSLHWRSGDMIAQCSMLHRRTTVPDAKNCRAPVD